MLVVSFTGDLTSQVLPSLEACRDDVRKSKATQIVLFFQQVESLSSEAISFFTQLQRDIRMKPAELRVCGLRPNIRERLVKMGIIRGLELAEDLKSALLSFDRL